MALDYNVQPSESNECRKANFKIMANILTDIFKVISVLFIVFLFVLLKLFNYFILYVLYVTLSWHSEVVIGLDMVAIKLVIAY